MTETWRLFIAIPLPDAVIAVLDEAQRALKKVVPPRTVTWVAPSNIHLTLKFLGEVPVAQRDMIAQALSRAVEEHGGLTLGTTGLGCFPNSRSPRVVWVGLGGDKDALHQLRDSVERAIAPLGYPTENRPFSPHLTLGRVRRDVARADAQRLGDIVHETTAPRAVNWSVTELILFRSELKPGGADYTKLHRAPLRVGR